MIFTSLEYVLPSQMNMIHKSSAKMATSTSGFFISEKFAIGSIYCRRRIKYDAATKDDLKCAIYWAQPFSSISGRHENLPSAGPGFLSGFMPNSLQML